jgi:type VI secretion system secreted protein VgrG
MPYTQITRHLEVATPLGDNVLMLTQLRGQEGISRLFHFDLELVSENPTLDLTSIIGKNITARVRQADDQDRFFNGIVSRFSQSGATGNLISYHVEMVPWLWMLTRTADCRVFQNMTVPDIILQVFGFYGFTDFRNALQATYPEREYVVQYRETDFNFVSRLMEQYGIFYFFEHLNGSHIMVLADSNAEFKPCPSQSAVRYQTTLEATVADEDVVTAWTHEQAMRPGRYSLMDYNFKTPAVNLQVNVNSVLPPPGGMPFEVYDYPGEYVEIDVGSALATVRMQEEEGQTVLIDGAGNCRTFVSGFTIQLFEHPRASENKTYVLTSVQHMATEGTYETGSAAGGFTYSNHFTALPVDVSFRAPRVTPKPVIQGLQTAIVCGVPGTEIYVDEYGRIKVQFHWDRINMRDENSSCWIRVSQIWAAKRWGVVFLPRVGQEVLVGFLEGDPDQPIVTGCVYNGDQTQPYELPTYQTRSVVRTDSTPGGGACNEIRFEDKKGNEELYMHASGEMNIHVEVNRHETVKKERHLEVYGNQIESIGWDKHLKVKYDDVAEIGGKVSRKIGDDLVQEIGGSHSEKAGNIYLKAGMNVVVEAGMQITLKVGGNFISISPAGVTIMGTMVLINSGGAPGVAMPGMLKPLKTVVGVDPPEAGTPDYSIFMPTTVADPGNASGSTSVEASEEDE